MKNMFLEQEYQIIADAMKTKKKTVHATLIKLLLRCQKAYDAKN